MHTISSCYDEKKSFKDGGKKNPKTIWIRKDPLFVNDLASLTEVMGYLNNIRLECGLAQG